MMDSLYMSTTFSLASRYAAVAVDRLQTPLSSKCQTFLRREVLSRIIAAVVFRFLLRSMPLDMLSRVHAA